jgi:5'-nucleotidase
MITWICLKLLLTNDDGFDSPSLKALSMRLSREHEVWIVAPDGDRSGSSHSITLKEPILISRKGERTFTCSGTPVDCVLLGILKLTEEKVDAVISGPNLGFNLGTDLLYSGTAAAARQGVLMGTPAIAASIAAAGFEDQMMPAIEFLARNLEIFHSLASSDHFLNINFPSRLAEELRACITFPSLRIYRDDIITLDEQRDEMACTIGGDIPESHMSPGSDGEAIASGCISISPIYVHPVNHKIEERYQSVSLWTGWEK